MSQQPRSCLIGCGAYLPQKVLTNADLASQIDTSDEWIRQRTGIEQRHIAADTETTASLATKAAEAALADAGVAAEALDLILVATATPDRTFPATATQVQAALPGCRAAAFDLQAVCSGFVYGLSVADAFIKSGQYQTILLIGAETFSRIVDWDDRRTSVLFGDGAGAVVLQANTTDTNRGILSTHLYCDGTGGEALYVDGGPSISKKVGVVHMNGREVFKNAVKHMTEAARTTLAANTMQLEDIDLFVPHQANSRIIESIAEKLAFPLEKVVITVNKHANTSAASIPLALAQAFADQRLKPGHTILLDAMGGGFTWGSCLLRL